MIQQKPGPANSFCDCLLCRGAAPKTALRSLDPLRPLVVNKLQTLGRMNAWILCHASDLAPWKPWEVAAVVELLLRDGDVVGHADGDVELVRPGRASARHARALDITAQAGRALFDILPTTPKTTQTKTAFALVLGAVRYFTQLDGDDNDEEKHGKR